MKKILLICTIFLLGSQFSKAQTTLYLEDFDNPDIDMSSYTLYNPGNVAQPFMMVGSDYILRDLPSVMTVGNPVTGFTGKAIGFEDVDGAGYPGGTPYILTNSISIAGYSNLTLDTRFACPRGNDGNRYEADDYIGVDYRIDGGAWVVAHYIQGNAINRRTYYDLTGDGVTDGTGDVLVSETAANFQRAIPGTGNTMEIRVRLNSLGPQEEFIFDDIHVQGVSTCSNPDVPSGLSASAASICSGSSSTLTWTGALNDATQWHIYSGSCGGTAIGTTTTNSFVVNPAVTTTYYIRGEDGTGCVDESTGTCGQITVTVDPITNQTVTAAASSFCINGSTTIDLGSSEMGINYYLRDNANDAIIEGPIAGTGNAISFNTGNITSTMTYNVYAEALGGGLNFDGTNDYVNTNIDIDHAAYSEFTFEAWVYPTRVNHGSRQTIFSNDDCCYDRGLVIESGSSDWGVAVGGSLWVVAGAGVDVNQWQHIAVVYDEVAKTAKFYKNGIEYVYAGGPTNFSTSANPMWIGRNPGYNESYQGDIDEVRIWSAARNTSEINAEINNCLVGNETGLLAYYKFDDGTGSSIAVDVAGGNNGTLVAMDPTTDWVDGASICSSCNSEMTQTATVTINALDNASFSYSAASYCTTDADPIPTITGVTGGTFISTPGLVLNVFTGQVDVSASTPDVYTVAYTTSGSCPNSSNVALTINTLDNASFSYSAASYCTAAADPAPTITGLPGGSFSATPAGLAISSSTGLVDVSASTPGAYTVTYTTAGSCPNSSNVVVTINANDDASYSYSASSYCSNDSDPTPTITGLPGGGFTSTPIGLSINSGTGAIDLSTSTPGAYTVTYTTTGACPNSSNVIITLLQIDTTTTVNGAIITSNAIGATYQWIDCNNGNSPISGATNQSYAATTNGDYAVVVTENGCSDTSSCVSITTVTISDNLITNKVSIYPNPTTDMVTIDFGNIENVSFQVYNTLGKLIMEEKNINSNSYQLKLNESSGVYFIKINTNGKSFNYKVIKE